MPNAERGNYDLAVFDVAGTTVEEHQSVYAALEGAIRAAGVDPTPAQVQSWMGADKQEAIASALLSAARVEPSREAVLGIYGDFRERLRVLYEATPPEPLPGIPAAIAALRTAGVRVALTTGFSREVTDELLKTLDWTDGVVDTVVSAEEVGAGRPAPFMIFEAMRRTGVFDVRRVLVAGDTIRDLQAGVNAGAGAVVGVLTGAQDATALGAVPHTHLLASVADIPGLVL